MLGETFRSSATARYPTLTSSLSPVSGFRIKTTSHTFAQNLRIGRDAMSLQTELSETTINVVRASNIVVLPPAELLRIVNDVCEALETNPASASEIALGFLRRIASHESSVTSTIHGGLAPWQKRKVERYLTENLERTIRLNELARETRLSVSHFCRAFKKSFGETPHTYLVRLRLALAQRLMLTTDDPLSQIALSCGLADQAHLSKLFRHWFDDTPYAWRRRNLTDPQARTTCQIVDSSIRRAA